jgi:hypothetical protein
MAATFLCPWAMVCGVFGAPLVVEKAPTGAAGGRALGVVGLTWVTMHRCGGEPIN